MDITSEANREMVRMWRVWRTTRQMLADRGYAFLPEELNVSLEEFRIRFTDPNGFPDRKNMVFSAKPTDDMIKKYTDPPTPARPNPPEPLIGTAYVEFNGEQSVGIKQVRSFVQFIDREKYFTGIFVTAVPVSATALKIGSTILPRQLEIFQESDLMVNITMHELVPKHVLLSKEEKMKLLDRYRLKETQLPRIQWGDPVARYLGLRKGQVVKIIRKSETAGRYASYRWCI